MLVLHSEKQECSARVEICDGTDDPNADMSLDMVDEGAETMGHPAFHSGRNR